MKKTFMELFWIFAIITFTLLYVCGRWLYCCKQRNDAIKNRKNLKRLYIVKDCATGDQLVVEMNNDFAIIEGTTLE